jgi:hypothetical protein
MTFIWIFIQTLLLGLIRKLSKCALLLEAHVGIGTTSPSTILHVASTAPYIRIQDTDSSTGVTAQGGFEMYDNDGDRLFYLANESSSSSDVSLFNIAGGALKFGTSGSERGQFDSSGRLLSWYVYRVWLYYSRIRRKRRWRWTDWAGHYCPIKRYSSSFAFIRECTGTY